jgi:hypothetical protein
MALNPIVFTEKVVQVFLRSMKSAVFLRFHARWASSKMTT